ncbi:MAG: hypothetical protein ACXWWG_00605 [Nitrospira sp.]
MKYLPSIISAADPQSAAVQLARALVKDGQSGKTDKNGRLRIILPNNYLLILTSPTQRPVALKRIQPNPGFRLAAALMEHSRIKNPKLLEPWRADPYWDQIVEFEPKIALVQEDDKISMRAEVSDREIVSDLLSSDVLQLSLMLELMAGTPQSVGRLAISLSGCYIDVDEHSSFLKLAELNDQPETLYSEFLPVPVLPRGKHGLVDFREEVELVLTNEVPPFGLRQSWLRRVAQPVLNASRAFIEQDPRWQWHINQISDVGWRESVSEWALQQLDQPAERTLERGGSAV